MTLAPPAASPTRRRRPVAAELLGDLVTLVVATTLLQLAFPDRIDLVAHVLAGAGVALMTAAVVPRRCRPWTAAVAVGACLVLAVAAELLQPGVLDFGDVAYTGAGALLLARGTTAVAHADRRWGAAAGLLGAAMVAAGFAFRHGR